MTVRRRHRHDNRIPFKMRSSEEPPSSELVCQSFSPATKNLRWENDSLCPTWFVEKKKKEEVRVCSVTRIAMSQSARRAKFEQCLEIGFATAPRDAQEGICSEGSLYLCLMLAKLVLSNIVCFVSHRLGKLFILLRCPFFRHFTIKSLWVTSYLSAS